MMKVGVVGLRRGSGLFRVFHNHKQTDVTALCDLDRDLAQRIASEHNVPEVYSDFDTFLNSNLDVVVVATPAPIHVTQSIGAMEAGCHVLSEVPAAYSLEECRALVSSVEKTGQVYMMAENMNYYHYVMDWRKRIQGGELGEVFYAEAEYIHDCRGLMQKPDGSPTWRASMPPIYYCTHSLGPLLDILDDRCVSVVGMATGSHTLSHLGTTDMEVGLFRTEKGRVLKVLCGFTVTREPGMHWQIFYGTKGTLENGRSPEEQAKVFKPNGEMTGFMPVLSDPDAPEEARTGGHGTTEYYMVDEFIKAVREGESPPIDVYRSLDFSVPGLCAHQSALNGGEPVSVPDFRPSSPPGE
jgi:predicted dehydrogenase